MSTIISQLGYGYQWVGLILLFITIVLDVTDYYNHEKEERKGFLSLRNAWARHIARLAFFIGSVIFVTAHISQIPDEANLCTYIVNIIAVVMMNAAYEFIIFVVATVVVIAIYHLLKAMSKGIKALLYWLTV